MNKNTLYKTLSQIRDMACTAGEYHRQGVLYPALQRWGAAPERRRDNRSDIYLLGLALSRQLTDREFPAEAAPVLQTLFARTLSPRPQGRYSCCEELVEDLDRALTCLRPCQTAADSS